MYVYSFTLKVTSTTCYLLRVQDNCIFNSYNRLLSRLNFALERILQITAAAEKAHFSLRREKFGSPFLSFDVEVFGSFYIMAVHLSLLRERIQR